MVVSRELHALTEVAQGKHTPNVRKIMQSQKTFTNYLDDFVALQSSTEANNNTSNNPARAAAANTNTKRPPPGKRDASTLKQPAAEQDTIMTDTELPSILPPQYKPAPATHPSDNNPLLASRVPELPSDQELRQLLAQPPLTYGEARGTWEVKYPTRAFCQVCGYWGRVKCTKCGTRVCALECLETHREECFTRYGM